MDRDIANATPRHAVTLHATDGTSARLPVACRHHHPTIIAYGDAWDAHPADC
jgi:hypothetical protein